MMTLRLRRGLIAPVRPMVMGIVNLGLDSFSGDGIENPRRALDHACQQVRDGADVIDVGAESAGTKRSAISVQEESDRLGAFIDLFRASEIAATPLSINTWRPAVVRAVLPLGGDILNDIGALPTDENARLCAEHGVALVIMHSVGEPKVAHTHVRHDDIMATLEAFFTERIALATAAGLSLEGLILDPGIDFAKPREDNLRIYRELECLSVFQRPLLLPVSRKTVIGKTLGIADPAQRDAGTVACIVSGLLRGGSIFRVHNVRAAVQTLRTVAAVEET